MELEGKRLEMMLNNKILKERITFSRDVGTSFVLSGVRSRYVFKL